ncbi:hypothetical protein [Asticcacaulis sp. AC402]|uniref:hypothetical protein n=1 Tax=Asticcacaulis sp. AC402 TaxID=1282361 RepID=UPI0003C3EFBC|nr:hypothetical protein [Asticcacaulis sp. AC402]ESQ74977.1 hypothetical protein ABAC402_11275 [Asticcacaulis sp. AC402]
MLKENEAGEKPALWKRFALIAVMAGSGALVGFGGGRFLKTSASDRPWSDELSLVIALALCGLGVLTLISRGIEPLGCLITQSDSKRLEPLMKRLLWLQGLTLVLAGLVLGAVPLLSKAAIENGMAIGLYAVLALVFAAQSGVNLLLWRHGDEFHRRTMLETGAVNFWVLQGALFLWAAAERLSLVPPLSSWDLMTVTMAVYLVLSSYIAWRLGRS